MTEESPNGRHEEAANRLVTVIGRLDGVKVPALDAVLSQLGLEAGATRDEISSALQQADEPGAVVADINQMYVTTRPPVEFSC